MEYGKQIETKTKRWMRTAVIGFAMVAVFSFLGTKAYAQEEQKPTLIAHGGGSIYGYDTTNSEEAVREAIQEGYTLIELDMEFSRDGEIIMLHDWDRTFRSYYGQPFEKKFTAKEFDQMRVNGIFHTLDFEELTGILDENPRIRIITDTKGDNLNLLKTIAEKYPASVSRMIPQIYNYEEYEAVRLLGYEDIILTLYAMPTIRYDELLSFTRGNKLFGVAVSDGHDYLIKDLGEKLARDGVLVYYHPVSDYEEARELMSAGIYGIYTSTLLPEEFDEPFRTYYLLDEKKRLKDVELEDRTLRTLKKIWIKNGAGKKIRYEIDGQEITEALLAGLDYGNHSLSVFVPLVDGAFAELPYVLWMEEKNMRILDRKYAYRLSEEKLLPNMKDTLYSVEGVGEDTREVLMNSLVVKSGAYYGYNDGEIIEFKVDGENLHVQNDAEGTVLVPFSECLKALGADSVVMDGGRYVYAYKDNVRTVLQGNTNFISRGMKNSRLSTPAIIYRDKVMAPGEAFRIILGREYLDNCDFLIILPENMSANDVGKSEIFNAAALLYPGNE